MKQIKLSPKRQAEFDKIVKWFMSEVTTHLEPKNVHAEMTRVKILSHLACLQGLLTDHISEHPLDWERTIGFGTIRAQGFQNLYIIEKIDRQYKITGTDYSFYTLKAAKAICQLVENDSRRELIHV